MHCLPVKGSILNLFQMVLPPDNRRMWHLQTPRHPYHLPCIECTVVGLPHPVGKFLGGEFRWLYTDWGFTFCFTQVQRIISLIICIILVVGNFRQLEQVHNPGNIGFRLFCWWLESFYCKANGGSPRYSELGSKWKSRAGWCLPIDWIV